MKESNVLIDNNSNARVSDFGLAVMTRGSTRGVVGTTGYQAPEILQNQYYTKQVDVWSLGVITFALMNKKLPFDEQNSVAQLEKISQTSVRRKMKVKSS
jgi:serine/threonine protein kinase